jgi:WD40 repeat protein
MLAELRGTNGEVLQPTSSNPARLTVPVAASLLSSAKSTIPLWYYDETIGLWKEEGSATLTGNAFVGDVKHFTAWNCDYSGPWGTLHGRVVCGGEPAPGVVVSFGALVAGGMPVVTTEQNGEFTIKVPANWDKLEYQIIAGNNMGLYYTNAPVHVIVATGETKELGDITLDSPCPSYLDGVIRDCDGKPTPGMVVARWSAGGLAYTYTVDGHYRMIVTPGNDVTLAATSADGHAAQPVSVHTGTSGQDINAPDLIACQETSESFIDIKGTYGYTELGFSPDGSKLAVQQDKDVVLYGAPSWSEVTRISTMSIRDSIRMPVFSKDGSKILLSASNGMQMEVYNVDGTKISTKSLPILTGVFSDDGSSVIGILKGSLVTYDLLGNQLSSVPLTAQDAYQILGRAADGSLVVPAYEHTYLLDPTTGAVKSDFPTSLYAWGMKVSANGHILGGWSSALHFYTLATGAEITPSAGLISNYAPFDIAPDDLSFVQALSTGGLTTLGFFTMADGTPKHLLEVDQSAGSPGAVAVTADGKHVAAVYQNGIRIWTLK